MNPVSKKNAEEQTLKFQLEGALIGCVPYGSGHINDTFAAYFQLDDGSSNRVIVQRVNSDVFKKPIEVIENVIGVTEYLKTYITKSGGDPARETLNLIPTKDGAFYTIDETGGCWRAYKFVENTVTLQCAKDPKEFYQSARAFGRFQMLLADYPANTLHETIPRFHDTVDRMRQFHEALKADKAGRAAGIQKEIEFVLEREGYANLLIDMQRSGALPLRVTHNDTKLNNVLLDAKTMEGICIIDLDTVMPGLSLYDFGDSIRFGASTAEEDERDLDKVRFSLELFDCYTKGYLEAAGKVMTERELDCLPDGAKMMTLECGVRFLTDYLSGDVYFKVHREGHNLDRARTQFKLVYEMEQQWDAMKKTVEKYR